ncbi:MAG: hypothetical protein J1E62_09140 [Lachnospiraceae bacterium]|nr:hypothetical protein [Lachnospiraceae bacterium]
MKQKILATVIGGIIIIFLIFPQAVSDSATEGLLMWFQVVLPTLLPFSIVSSVIMGLGLTGGISRVVAPVLCRFFGISRLGCYPVVVGMLSGYPLGAATVAKLYQQGDIDKREAQYILHFCNNASPMFLVEFIGVSCLGLHKPIVMLLIVYLAGWLGAFCERFIFKMQGKKIPSVPSHKGTVKKGTPSPGVIKVLDESILHSFVMLTKVGGYIILFSILAGVVRQMWTMPEIWKGSLVSILEITTGAISVVGAAPGRLGYVLLAGFSAFGGLSSVAQTASVLSETDLSVVQYLIAKIRQGLFAMGICWLMVSIL